MPEPISFIGPAVTALTLVYNALQPFLRAEREARNMASLVNKLIGVMRHVLDDHLSSSFQLSNSHYDQLASVSLDCEQTAGLMEKRLLVPGKKMAIGKKVKWVFNSDEMKGHMDQLNAYFDVFQALQLAITDYKVEENHRETRAVARRVDGISVKMDQLIIILARVLQELRVLSRCRIIQEEVDEDDYSNHRLTAPQSQSPPRYNAALPAPPSTELPASPTYSSHAPLRLRRIISDSAVDLVERGVRRGIQSYRQHQQIRNNQSYEH